MLRTIVYVKKSKELILFAQSVKTQSAQTALKLKSAKTPHRNSLILNFPEKFQTQNLISVGSEHSGLMGKSSVTFFHLSGISTLFLFL